MRYFKVHKMFIKNALMKNVEYRGEFFVALLHLSIFTFFNVAFYRAIFANTKSIGGWSYPEIVVLIGTFMIMDALFHIFLLRNLANIDGLVRRGEFDSVLTKPMDSQFLVSVQFTNLLEVPGLILGLGVVTYGLEKLNYFPDSLHLLGYGVFLLASFVILYTMGIIFCSLAFYIEKIDGLHEILISFFMFAKLPDVYSGFIKIVFMMFMPIVFASYVPSGLLLNKVPLLFLIYYFLVSMAFIFISRKIWKFSLKYYKSAGG